MDIMAISVAYNTTPLVPPMVSLAARHSRLQQDASTDTSIITMKIAGHCRNDGDATCLLAYFTFRRRRRV